MSKIKDLLESLNTQNVHDVLVKHLTPDRGEEIFLDLPTFKRKEGSLIISDVESVLKDNDVSAEVMVDILNDLNA